MKPQVTMDGQFRLKRVSFLWTGSVWVSINCSFFPFGPNILYTVYYPVYTSNNIFLILHCMYLNRFKVVYLQSVTTGIYSKMSTAILYVLTISIIIRRFILAIFWKLTFIISFFNLELFFSF